MEQRKEVRRRYTNGQRKALLAMFQVASPASERQFCRDNQLPFSTWQAWRSREAKIMASKRHNRLATTGGQGHKELIPFGRELLDFMRGRREEERYVRVYHMMNWVK
ncbi:hypothetical protein H257_11403 [Aphanomyces astaci]|uniref:Transposase n=1 Tax=Aphanomyces astaci TaxID=112090 RepID=W4G352_APHAT|nr:hypothetical protein H257_11403 [Aphanomyces astaci]ETV74100.1 hypothetical protein H257_11403 [Aphanomyces astaci]|eukprot:XP_009836613.1 hypothetical protein H257_11403 [Aphanomyces astaci]